MALSDEEYQSLLAVKGVGKTFIARLAQMGLDDVQALADTTPEYIQAQGAALTGSSCYKNSPQAREAAKAAIAWAQQAMRQDTKWR